MKWALVLAAVGEAVTGVALLVVPSLVGRLLLGDELAGVAVPVARVAGIALIALAIACWPGKALIGMLVYSAAVTAFLAYVGFTGGRGVLLWPAVVLHAILTALLVLTAIRDKRRQPGRQSLASPAACPGGGHCSK